MKKDNFSKEYVLGMLETLVEMQGGEPLSVVRKAIAGEKISYGGPVVVEKEISQEELLDKLAAARLKEVQEMSTVDMVTQSN